MKETVPVDQSQVRATYRDQAHRSGSGDGSASRSRRCPWRHAVRLRVGRATRMGASAIARRLAISRQTGSYRTVAPVLKTGRGAKWPFACERHTSSCRLPQRQLRDDRLGFGRDWATHGVDLTRCRHSMSAYRKTTSSTAPVSDIRQKGQTLNRSIESSRPAKAIKSGGNRLALNVSAQAAAANDDLACGGPGRTRTCNQTVMSGRL